MPVCPTASSLTQHGSASLAASPQRPRPKCCPSPSGPANRQPSRSADQPTGVRSFCLFVVLPSPFVVFVSWPPDTVSVFSPPLFAPSTFPIYSASFAHRNSRRMGCHRAVTQEATATVPSWCAGWLAAAVYMYRTKTAANPPMPARAHARLYVPARHRLRVSGVLERW